MVGLYGLLLFQPQNAPMNTVAEQRDIEIDQKAHFPTTQRQAGKKLRVMNRRQVVDSLELYYDGVRNNQVTRYSQSSRRPLYTSGRGCSHKKGNPRS